MAIEIVPFDQKYSGAFYHLNIEWLETYFYVEDFDKEVLSKPEKYIITPGGHIFFAIEDGLVLGTVALMKAEDKIYELTKMAVLPNQRGRKIGQKLMQYCIDFSKQHNFKKLFLYSNTKLENAIYIYRKYGFLEIPVEANSPYERSNIKMELYLS
jgi:N-acetylglutamate synthase-like GNAT family acetyltransferase